MIFEFDNYREFLRAWVREQRSRGQPVTFQALAQQVGIQKSYFSKVLNGEADLSSDQVFLLASSLGLSEDEAHYLELLVELQRTGLADRKDFLRRKVQQMQKQFLLSSSHLSKSFSSAEGLEDYYLNPLLQVLHIGATLEDGESPPTTTRLSKSMGLAPELTKELIERLEELGVLQKDREKGWVNQMPGIHLKREHPLTKLNHYLMRAMSLFQIMRRPWNESYTLSVTFSADDQAEESIQKEFQYFLKKVEGIVSQSKNQKAYQINFDLYPWS
ncbi:MAG: TIGR02147 family protein [Bdellovibrionaceae bacterium]|nr:TIGR02147 family protein [Bdellovibrionales bacterium]MCB9083989.1 TIGR02147 family protein [Pseudobdellovibrionaceae bacterium]